jgi:hypothetical protein
MYLECEIRDKPNNRLNIGFIGIGMQNRGHIVARCWEEMMPACLLFVMSIATSHNARETVVNRYKERSAKRSEM